MMRSFARASLVATAITALSLISARAQETIRIGVLQPMTGPATKNGTENYTAMQIARDMINERGGINGRKVELLLADIPTPTAAISETERLITKDGVKMTLGSGCRCSRSRSARPRSATACSIGRPPARPTSSPSEASSTPSRSGRRPTATPGGGRFHARGARPSGSASRPPTCASHCCGKTAPSASRSAMPFAPTPRKRASIWSTMKATTSSRPT